MHPTLQSVLACPRCHGVFTVDGERLQCDSCQADFSCAGGIPRLSDGATARDPKIAAEWEAQKHALPLYVDAQSVANKLEERMLPRIVDWLGTVEGPILDLGCGVGYFAKIWGEHGRPSDQLIGLDLQMDLLHAIQGSYAAMVEGDVHRLPLKDGAFSAIVIANALHHMSDPVRALIEARRVLRPGGRVIACDPRELSALEMIKKALRRQNAAFTAYHRAFRPDDYRRMFKEAGLTLARLETVDPVGPLFAAGLDLLRAGRIGIAETAAGLLSRADQLVEQFDSGHRFGLMVMAEGVRS